MRYLDFTVEVEVGGVKRVVVGDYDTVAAGAGCTASEVGVFF